MADLFEQGVRATLKVLADKPPLMDALRDGRPVSYEIDGTSLALKADGQGRSPDKLERQLNDARADADKAKTTHEKRLKSKDDEIASLKKQLDAKAEECRMLAQAKAGEVKYVVADVGRR